MTAGRKRSKRRKYAARERLTDRHVALAHFARQNVLRLGPRLAVAFELGVVAEDLGLSDELDQAVSDRLELALEQQRRDAVLVGRAVAVDHDDLPALLERGRQPPEERVRLG